MTGGEKIPYQVIEKIFANQEDARKVISVLGAGGKTTLIHRLADYFRAQGKKVLVTTTTHMAVEEDSLLSGNAEEIGHCLHRQGYCMAGLAAEKKPEKLQEYTEVRKMMSLPGPVLKAAIEAADITLIEADGAKHHNVKFPRDGEPVIAPETTDLILVMGLADIGKAAEQVIFRFEELCCFQKQQGMELTDPGRPLDMELIGFLIEEGYRKPLRQKYPDIPLHVVYAHRQDGKLLYQSRKDGENS